MTDALATLQEMGTPAGVARARAYRPDIDGLRSLAIGSVVLYHAGVSGLPGGFTGVDVFFVISGYLIGGHIHAEIEAGTFRFAPFYRNRAKRILPALYVVLVAVLVAGSVLLSPRELRDVGMNVVATTASAANVLLWRTTNYFAARADQNPLLMTWSLGVEEQFYLIVPVLLVGAARVRRRLSLPLVGMVCAASFGVACFQVGHHPTAAFYLLDSRAWELGVGVGLAMLQAEFGLLAGRAVNGRGWVGLGLVVGPFFLLRAGMPFPGVAAVPSVAGAALLLSAGGGWVNRRVLSLPPLVFVGRISYSLYLVHWPLLAGLRILNGGLLPKAWGLGAVGVAFGLAVLLYRWVEIPFRASRRAPGALLVRYGAVSAGLLLVAGGIVLAKGMPWRYGRAAAVDAAAQRAHEEDGCLVESAAAPVLREACTGARVAGRHVALWGDSHASVVAPAVRETAARQGYFMEEYAKTICPPLLGAGRYYRGSPEHLRACVAFNRAVLERLVSDPRVEVVVLEAFWDAPFDPEATTGELAMAGYDGARRPTQAESEAILRAALGGTLRALVAAGKRVVVLGDAPVFAADPVWRMRTAAIPLRGRLLAALGGEARVDTGVDRAADDLPPERAAQRLLRETAVSVPGVTFWDVRRRLCDGDDLCAYRRGETALFADTNHVTVEGARVAMEGWAVP